MTTFPSKSLAPGVGELTPGWRVTGSLKIGPPGDGGVVGDGREERQRRHGKDCNTEKQVLLYNIRNKSTYVF